MSTRDIHTAIVPKLFSSHLGCNQRGSHSKVHEATRCTRQVPVVGVSKITGPSWSWTNNTLIEQALPGSSLCWCLYLGTFCNLSARCLYHLVAANSAVFHKYENYLGVVPTCCQEIAPV